MLESLFLIVENTSYMTMSQSIRRSRLYGKARDKEEKDGEEGGNWRRRRGENTVKARSERQK